MNRIQLKALLFTFLILGSLTYYLFGGFDIKLGERWEDLKTMLWSSNESEDVATKKTTKQKTLKSSGKEGKKIDNYAGVAIYDNGKVSNVSGRNVTADGYNLGLKYQCVEFVKRFYYEYYNHKMPDSYGHAKDFFDTNLADGAYNAARGLTQYRDGSRTKPKANDLIVFGGTPYNQFGHVAIVSRVTDTEVEIAQQNPGTGNPSRERFSLSNVGGTWKVGNKYILGWLRK